jgi:hypothetical protein
MLGRGLDVSASGVGIEGAHPIEPGTTVHIEGTDGFMSRDYFVKHCTHHGRKYHLGFELINTAQDDARKSRTARPVSDADTDYYDVLQISPKAQSETIHRVFRIMAVRFHPDNPETGDLEEFLRLKRAYAVLSDPASRAEYDAKREAEETTPLPIFELKDFVTGVEAESNRRLGVLSLLYSQRRTDPDHPGVSLLDLETRMGFPREYLTFTLWYLRSKDYIAAADNSDFTLNAAGVDFIEMNAPNNEILTRLLIPGGGHCRTPMHPLKTEPEQPKHPESKFLLGAPQ